MLWSLVRQDAGICHKTWSALLRDSSLVQETKTKQALKDPGNRLPSVFVAEKGGGGVVFFQAKNFLPFSLFTYFSLLLLRVPVRNRDPRSSQSMGLSAVGRQC